MILIHYINDNIIFRDDLSWFCNSYDEKRNKIKPIKEMYKPKLTPSRSPLSRIDGTTPVSYIITFLTILHFKLTFFYLEIIKEKSSQEESCMSYIEYTV